MHVFLAPSLATNVSIVADGFTVTKVVDIRCVLRKFGCMTLPSGFLSSASIDVSSFASGNF